MSAYEAPEKNLAIFDPTVFTSNDEPLTITTGSKYFLKYPYAQGTENFNTLSANQITSAGDLLLNPVGSVDCNGKTLNMTNGEIHNCPLVHSQNNQDITIEGKGTGDVIIKTNNINRMQFTDTGNINTLNPLLMTSTTAANRAISSSQLILNENTGVYSSTALGQIYQTSGNQYHQNLINNGSINLVVKDSGGTNVTPISLSSSVVSVPSNVNFNMLAGTGIINQPRILNTNTAINSIKRSNITTYTDSLVGSSTTALEVFNDYNGRGCFIIPDSSSGALNSIVQANDCFFGSRAPNNSNSFVLSNWGDTANGIRVSTTSSTACSTTLRTGTNLIQMSVSGGVAQPTTINHNLNFNSTAPLTRQLQNIGTMNLLDINGNGATNGTSTANIYLDSTLAVPGMVYDCNLNNGYHIFSTNDAGGVETSPIYFGSALTSISNTLTVRNAITTSNRFDVATDNANNTNIRARSTTASTNALININCDSVSAGGVTTNNAVATVAPTYFQLVRPIQLSYSTLPSAMNQIGFQSTTTLSSVVVASSAAIRSAGSYTFTDAGTYIVNWGVYSTMSSGTATFTDLQFGIANTASNTFDSYTFTYPSLMNLKMDYPILTTADSITLPTSCVYRATTGGKIAYFNYLANYTGGTNILIGGTYTITRIG